VERFGESHLILRLTVKTAPLKQWEVGRELRRRIKNRFDEMGIQIPYRHRAVLWGDKEESQTKDQNPKSKYQMNVK
jgi:small conductance mechanosensitive channel